MTPEERSVLAGEFALGVLDGPERAQALRLLVADPGFAREVERWREHFAVWFAEFGEVEPDPGLEERILGALPGGAANDDAGRAVRLWRAVAGGASLAAAGLLAALLLQPERAAPPAPPRPAPAAPAPLVAALDPTPDAGGTLDAPLAAVFDRATGTLTLASAVDVPAGRAAELWTIAGDGVPRSLGVLGTGNRLTVRPEARGRLAAGVVLAVSVEPPGGSPTGSPTGPVVATGALSAV
ncbi:anti-sigma factor [Sphingomonas lenta]|uniref:Regulator of SigK n=1 Tax=Sphingomonas lenta TaxID=1141887 RepID=A0A2A2SCB2_9SPHN|nr:anti-sigma factor [Sphingomonas lenta]PAX06853.1 anti-sigma factor [Sphingomonas lenta]